jgi:pimeloyl-ACP methyl ester carboxylesterase
LIGLSITIDGKEAPMLMLTQVVLTLTLLQTGQTAPAVQDAYFDSNGVKIHYTVQGAGEPVLLIHGFTANIPIQWDNPGVTAALAAHYKVIALDNRGHGKSGKPHDAKKYGPEMVEDSIRLLDHLKIKKAHIVGYSMGAMLAGDLLALHPSRCLSVVLGGAGIIRKSSNVEFFETLATSLEKDKSIGPLIDYLTPAGQPKPTADQIKGINFLLSTLNDMQALAAVVRSWKSLTVSDDALKANKVPVLGLVGDRDPLRSSLEDLKGVLAGLKIETIPGGDHMNTFAMPQFAAAIKQFLAKHPAKQTANAQ